MIFIRLSHIFIEGNKEQIQQILTRSTLIIYKGKNIIFNKFQNLSKSSNIQLTNILVTQDITVYKASFSALLISELSKSSNTSFIRVRICAAVKDGVE